MYDRPAVLSLLGDIAGLTVLDADGGPGLYADSLLRRDADVIGFDQAQR
jgi:2-polyprenyl-3-methyl-5-hydroxy-6-metoxy-1,4-benzoquinol methylase